MYKSIFVLITMVLCSCTPRQTGVTSKTESRPSGEVKGQPGEQPGAQPSADAPTLFPVKIGDQYGYINRKGKVVLPATYAGASRFSEGLAPVQLVKMGKVGYIDVAGKLVIPAKFDVGDPFSEGLAAVMHDHSWGYIDKTGIMVIPATFRAGERFSQGKAVVGVALGPAVDLAYINTKGEFWQTARFEYAMPFGEGLAAVRSMGQLVRFIDESGKTAIPPKYLTAGEFSSGLAPVEIQLTDSIRWGFVDKGGNLVISAHFLKAYPFSEGLAAVQSGDSKWGYIDTKGTMVIPPKYDDAELFRGGLAQVAVNKATGYIDTKGKYVWEPK